MLPKLHASSTTRTTFTKEPARAEATLLALALSGFLAAAGCGDDEGAALLPDDAGRAGSSNTEADAASESDASNGSDDSTQAAQSDGGLQATATNSESPSALGLGDAGNADVDQDGVSVADGDCNDFNDAVFPGASELSLDAVDSDCDGEDAPAVTLVWSSEATAETPNLIDALALLDADEDGTIAIDEFEAGCAKSAKLHGEAGPGILQFHASCAATNSCRGMVLQTWGELYEHSCRGVNKCAGWSCVETATDQARDGGRAFADGHCGNCHSSEDGTFKVLVPPGRDPVEYLDNFWGKRSDAYLQSTIAFGISYTSEDGYRMANMPPAYHLLSRAEIDGLIATLRLLPLSFETLDVPRHLDHGETTMDPMDTETTADSETTADAGAPDAN
jgi:Putative metal-binding motif